MTRPCFLVVDREYSANISTRKLIIETAKFNVITAYSGAEAIESVRRFPAVDGVVLDTTIRNPGPAEVAREIKKMQPRLPVIVICSAADGRCPDADYHLEYFDPASLLELLQKLYPEETASIQARNRTLSDHDER